MRGANNVLIVSNKENISQLYQKKIKLRVSFINNARKVAAKKQQLDDAIRKHKHFLWRLHNKPDQLVEEIHKQIAKTTEDIDANYPLIKSASLCKTLFHLRLYNTLINEKLNRDNQCNKDFMRSLYLQYCGLLSSTLEELAKDSSHISKKLSKHIVTALATTHIKFDGNFPDELAQHDNSIDHFKYHNRPMDPLDSLVFSLDKLAAHITIVDELKDLFKRRNHVSTQVFPLAEKIVDEFIANECSGQANNEGQARFNIIALNATYQLLQDPFNYSLQNRYMKLADQASGCSTLRKKLAGIMYSLLGGILVLGCLYFMAVSFGLMTPVAVVVLGSIINTFTSGVLGFASVIGMGAGSYVSISRGMKFFENNARHGLSLNMTELAECCKKSTMTRI